MIGRLTRTRLLASALVCAAALTLAPAVTAARPSNAGGGKGGSATLTVSPNPVPSWSTFSGKGCGYTVGKPVNVVVNSPYWNAGFPTGVDAGGCIDFGWSVDGPGTYVVKTMQNLNGSKQTVLATASLTVY